MRTSEAPRKPAQTPSSRPLTAAKRAEVQETVARLDAVVDALNLVESAYGTVAPSLAYEAALHHGRQLGDDVEHLHRVIAALAVEGVWQLPGSDLGRAPRTADEIFVRQAQLRQWVWDRRRVTMIRLRQGRAMLRRPK